METAGGARGGGESKKKDNEQELSLQPQLLQDHRTQARAHGDSVPSFSAGASRARHNLGTQDLVQKPPPLSEADLQTLHLPDSSPTHLPP